MKTNIFYLTSCHNNRAIISSFRHTHGSGGRKSSWTTLTLLDGSNDSITRTKPQTF